MGTCNIIAISRAIGAGGDEIGHSVAKQLGFRLVEDEVIDRAAEDAGVSPETVAESEKTPGLITRILESLGRTPMAAEGFPVAEMYHMTHTPDYEALIQKVIRQTAAEGNVVILSHGASIPLAGTPGLLRVLVTASPETRASRLTEQGGPSGEDAEEAIEHSDRQRRDFLRRFYDVDEELPTHYDLVLNTDVLSYDEAARLIVASARE
jgi:cytidylate kinase